MTKQPGLFPAPPPTPKRIRDARAHDAAIREAARVILSDPEKYDSPAMQEVARREMEKGR